MKVFISYAREDWEIAEKVWGDLKQAGIDAWIDRKELLPGQNWKTEISRAIRASSHFIALLSTRSVSRQGFFHTELKKAIDVLDTFPEHRIYFIPVRIDDCEPGYERLGDIHWADLFPSYENGFSHILQVLMVFDSEKNEKSNIQDEQSQYVPLKTENIADIAKKDKPSPTRNLAMKTYRVILIVGMILLVNIVYMTTQPHILNKLIEIFQGRISIQEEKPPLKYQLRKKPITVSDDEALKTFSLKKDTDGWRRLLEYMESDLKDNGDGTITDHASGLIWQKSGSDKLSYKDAESYIKKINDERFASYSDWRMPTVDELKSLLTPIQINDDLCIDPIFDKMQRWCWTSDKRASGGAWLISFYNCSVGWNKPNVVFHVRAVRSIQ